MDKLLVLGEQLGLTFRWSIADDEKGIDKLIDERFGNRYSYGVLDDIEGRYFVAVNSDNEIVAITGLNDSKVYNGLEIDWTCIDGRYTGYNLMSFMIEYILKDCEKDVYCSCWRLNGHPINLMHAMQHNGFNPVLVPRISFDSMYNALCQKYCKNYNPVDGSCKCCEDLYCRKARVRND